MRKIEKYWRFIKIIAKFVRKSRRNKQIINRKLKTVWVTKWGKIKFERLAIKN